MDLVIPVKGGSLAAGASTLSPRRGIWRGMHVKGFYYRVLNGGWFKGGGYKGFWGNLREA